MLKTPTNFYHSKAMRVELVALTEFKSFEKVFNRMIQTLSNHLYYGLTIVENYSGYRTESSIQTNQRVKEHPIGRYEATHKLYELAISDVSDIEFYEHWTKFRQYHLTTRKENQDLKKFHKNYPDATPEHAYASVCSPLVEWLHPSQIKR